MRLKTHDYIEATHKIRGSCNKQNFVAFDFCVSQLLYFLQDLALVVGVKCNRWCRSLSVCLSDDTQGIMVISLSAMGTALGNWSHEKVVV